MKYLRVYDTEADKNSDSLSSAVSSLPVVITVRNPLSVIYGRNYIENGLVFHLDGIDKGSTANAWTDLIGGHVFTKNNSSITSDNNSFIFTSDANGYLKNSDTIDFNYLSSTIEITYKPTVANKRCLLFLQKTVGSISYGYFDNGRRACIYPANPNAGGSVANAEHVFSSDLYNTVPHTISINKNAGILDFSNNRTSIASNYWGGNNTINTIGNRELNNSGTKFVGHIYSIRIYNRLLSADEMRHNQMIDNKRFNLGL